MKETTSPERLLDHRLLQYAARIIAVAQALPKTTVGAHVANQMLRCGTSAGANYREACAAESRADFIHKTQIALKELRETDYRLSVASGSRLLPATRLVEIARESNEPIAMTVRSVVTAKERRDNERRR